MRGHEQTHPSVLLPSVLLLGRIGPFTVFAPADDAFSQAPWADYRVKYLLDPAHKAGLAALLKYHVISSSVTSADLTDGKALSTVEGQALTIHVDKATGAVAIDDVTCSTAHIDTADLKASNGVVHVVSAAFTPFGVFCPDTVFAAEQRGDGRISAYGYDCRRKGFTHIATEASTKPVGITVDDASRSIFWSNDQDYPHGSPTSWASGITYAGKNKRHVLQDIIDPQGLYAEPTHKHLYYTEHSGYKITRSNFDGTNKTVLVSKPGNTSFQPSDVAVDLDAGKLFASVEFPENLQVGYIAMFDIDGTNEQVLVPPPVGRPYGICVDTVHKNLFYIVGGHGGQIRCVSYGEKPCDAEVVQDILEYPYMCDVDNTFEKYGGPTKLIFSQANLPGQIFVSTTDGKEKHRLNKTDVISVDDLQAPMGIALGCLGTGDW